MRAATTGRGWAYFGALLGGIASTAANVAHSYVPPEGVVAEDWSPEPGAVIGAVFWPLALFVAVEIFARTAWPVGPRWAALRFAGLLPVAAVAAIVSYRHLSGLLDFYGDDTLTVVIGPLAVDGLMVMATAALIATGNRRTAGAGTEPAPEPAPLVPASVAGDETGALPADPAPTTGAAVTPPDPTPAPAPARQRPAPAKPAGRAPKRQPSAADKVARALARTPEATPAQIAARLKLSERTVQRHMPKPDPANTDGDSDDSVSTLRAA